MSQKHKIEISYIFKNTSLLLDVVNVYINGFMKWLAENDHEVSFSQLYLTLVDGYDIKRDRTAQETFDKLTKEYQKYLEKNNAAKT